MSTANIHVEEVLDELEKRIRDQAEAQPVGSMAWRAHMAEAATEGSDQ